MIDDLDSLIESLIRIRLQHQPSTAIFIKIDTDAFIKACDTGLYSIDKILIEEDDDEDVVVISPLFFSMDGN